MIGQGPTSETKPGWDGRIAATPNMLHGKARVAEAQTPVRAEMSCPESA